MRYLPVSNGGLDAIYQKDTKQGDCEDSGDYRSSCSSEDGFRFAFYWDTSSVKKIYGKHLRLTS